MSDEKIKNDANQHEEQEQKNQEQNPEMNPDNPVQEEELQPDVKSRGDQETEDYLMQLKRVQAEFVNFKKRNEKRMADYQDYVRRDVLSRLLPVVDDFDILFQHHENEPIGVEGVQLIYNKMILILEELGLEPIESQGQEFDPELHEAVLTEATHEAEEGTVLKEWQKGFQYKGSLLRPAKVVTAVRASNEDNDESE